MSRALQNRELVAAGSGRLRSKRLDHADRRHIRAELTIVSIRPFPSYAKDVMGEIPVIVRVDVTYSCVDDLAVDELDRPGHS